MLMACSVCCEFSTSSVVRHSRAPISGLPEIGTFSAHVGYSRHAAGIHIPAAGVWHDGSPLSRGRQVLWCGPLGLALEVLQHARPAAVDVLAHLGTAFRAHALELAV